MVKRKIYNSLQGHLSKKEYSILTGARQTGKTTILRQLEAHCKQAGIPCEFLNLENKAILAELNGSPLNVFKFLPDTSKRTVVLVDEIQYLDDPSNFLKLLYDDHSSTLKVVATGSSAFYIDGAFKDSLAGRKKLFHLFTCAFDEYLMLTNKADLVDIVHDIVSGPGKKTTQIQFLQNQWENFLVFGGYPAIITATDNQDRIERLQELRDSFIKRDVLESNVSNETAFYHLFRILAAQCGNLININELSLTLRVRRETVLNYLTIMQKCFHVGLISPFYKNLRKELVKMPKAYLLDNGLRNCLLNDFSLPSFRTDRGQLWENMVYRLLAEAHGFDSIKYWRTANGNEVDFICHSGEEPAAIEVKYDKSQINKKKYKVFEEAYPDIRLSFLWMQPFDEEFFRSMNQLIPLFTKQN